MKIGIIGTGRHGSRYAHHINYDLPELRLAAISRRSALGREQAEDWGVHCHHDWRDLVADADVEAVLAVTTPNLHEDIALACATAGKPVFIEKPLATEAAAAVRMIESCRTADVSLTVGQTLRYNPIALALREEFSRIGRFCFFFANLRLEQTKHTWLDDPSVAGAGVILHTAVHVFDALRFITGREITEVTARVGKHNCRQVEDLFSAMIEMEDGVRGCVDASKVSRGRSGRFEFVGDRGQLQGDQVHGYLEFIEGVNISQLKRVEPVPAIIPLLRDWAAHLAGKGPNPIPGEEGLQAVRICQACLMSARDGRSVPLAEVPNLHAVVIPG